jgi:dTDP-4-amino-4,6-dideoxygalactose transaminase
LACLSVRSGFDLVLQQLALPRGSEVLVSAITIRDMVNIMEHHGLVAVPLDLEPESCAVQTAALERALTANTKALVVAHLFGNRMPMDDIAAFAQRHKLFLFEDCAQAFAADGYRGHAGSNVVMFSFGTIKTASAGGGALLNFKSDVLRHATAAAQQRYAVQQTAPFARKLLKLALLKVLSSRLPYTLFVFLCRAFGKNHDAVISGAVRGFPGAELMRQLRRQPAAALLALLERRLRRYTPAMLAPRMRAAATAMQNLPADLQAGTSAALHSHWVFPVRSERPDQLVCHLWRHGYDATRGASSMYAVPAPDAAAPATEANRLMAQIVYLPADCCDGDGEIRRMSRLVAEFEATGQRSL